MVSSSVFYGVDYTALGHLHGPHVVGETVRYSGSPLAYSFSEADQRKGSWLVDLGRAWCHGGRVRRGAGPPAAPGAPRRARRPAGRPRAGRPQQAWLQVDADRRDPARAGDGAAARPVPPHPRAGARAEPPGSLGRRPAPGCAAAPTTTSPSTSSPTSAGRPPPTRSPRCCSPPATPAPTTPRSTPCSPPVRSCPVRLHHLEVVAFGPFAETRRGRLRRALRRRPVPADRRHRRRQDQRPGRRVLRPLRRRPRRPSGRQAAALRPRGPRRRPGGHAGVLGPRPPVPGGPLPRLGPTSQARHRHHPRAGQGAAHRARRRHAGSPARPGSTRPATWSPTCSA